jgi:hypothetical protein
MRAVRLRNRHASVAGLVYEEATALLERDAFLIRGKVKRAEAVPNRERGSTARDPLPKRHDQRPNFYRESATECAAARE